MVFEGFIAICLLIVSTMFFSFTENHSGKDF